MRNKSTEQELIQDKKGIVDESVFFTQISKIIENRKVNAGAYANREVTLMYWEVGRYINLILLGGERAGYGKRIVSELATQLVGIYGRSFDVQNIRRMMKFAEKFNDFEMVSELATQLSWSHFVELLPIKSEDGRLYYAREASLRHFGTKELRRQIARKAYERQEIADMHIGVD